jgi:predicted small secreted protein
MRTPSLALIAVLLATTLAACGGGSGAGAYIEQVTKAQQAAEVDASALTSDIATATTPEAIATKLDAFGASVKANGAKLAAIKPPQDVAAEHKAYVAAINTFGTELQSLAAEAKSSSPAAQKALLAKAAALSADLSTAETKIVTDINTKLQT